MKKTTMAVLTGLTLAFAPMAAHAVSGISINGRDIIRIDVDDEQDDIRVNRGASIQDLQQENKRLRRRLHRLEQAVRQLQDRTYNLEAAPRVVTQPVTVQAGQSTCYIKTTFHGTVMGKGASEAEARANALQACEKADGGFDCEESKTKCSR